jgi:hypothetical protein
MIPKVLRLPGFVIVDKVGEPMAFAISSVHGCAIFQSEELAQSVLQEYLKESEWLKR